MTVQRFRHIAIRDIEIVANQPKTIVVGVTGITDDVGYDARMDFRSSDDETSTLFLSLSSPSDGITLAINDNMLIVVASITEVQVDALRAAASSCRYSLKVTPPDGPPRQWIKGTITYIGTATP